MAFVSVLKKKIVKCLIFYFLFPQELDHYSDWNAKLGPFKTDQLWYCFFSNVSAESLLFLFTSFLFIVAQFNFRHHQNTQLLWYNFSKNHCKQVFLEIFLQDMISYLLTFIYWLIFKCYLLISWYFPNWSTLILFLF